jgi:hypothetical protein
VPDSFKIVPETNCQVLHHTKFETEQSKASVAQHYETKVTQSPNGKGKERKKKSIVLETDDVVNMEEYRQK